MIDFDDAKQFLLDELERIRRAEKQRMSLEQREWCKVGWGYKPRLTAPNKYIKPITPWLRTRSNPKLR